MKTSRLLPVIVALLASAPAIAGDIPGTVTITGGAASGNLIVTGVIDSDGSTFTFGPGAAPAVTLTYNDNSLPAGSADTLKFGLNRNPASWLWEHSSAVAAMRLDGNHQLILYRSNDTTAGITFNPGSTTTSSSIKLGTNASSTLTADNTTGVITAGGGFEVAGNLKSTSSSSTTSFMGNVGIGTASPGSKLQVVGGTLRSDLGTTGQSFVATGHYSNLQVTHDGTSYLGLHNSGGGIQFRASDGATNIMTVASNGRVGIGTIYPSQPLDVRGGYIITMDAGGTSRAFMEGSTGVSYFGNLDTGDVFIGNSANWGALTVKHGGNVGIGTASPGRKLVVEGAGEQAIEISSTGSGARRYGFVVNPSWASGSWHLYDFTGDATRMTVSSAGNVGIGMVNPANRLGVRQDLSDPGQSETVNFEQTYAVTATDTDYIKALDVEKNGYNVPAGVTANGYQIGIASQVFVNDANFQGTIDRQYGIWSRTGIYTAGASGARTINEAFGIYLEGLTEAGTISNHYGIYQTGTGTKNYFAGNVGIGTTNPGAYKLAVNGTIHAKEVVVDNLGWADYVFDESYRLAPLAEVESHIKAKKHLPGIPSAAEVAEHGVSMGDMQAKLLSKVEELTLHLIAQEKRAQAQQAEIAALRNELAQLKATQTP